MQKPIPNYENYLVDENGNVFSKNIGRYLKQRINEKGYKYVTLYKNDIRRKWFIHRCVACAFLPNPLNLPQVNHKDENKQNNHLSNLEWCDNSYNQMYGNARKNRIEKIIGRKVPDDTKRKIALNQPSRKEVAQYDLNNNLVKIWESQTEAGRNGFNQTKIGKCCLKKQNTHKGYKWRFLKDVLP